MRLARRRKSRSRGSRCYCPWWQRRSVPAARSLCRLRVNDQPPGRAPAQYRQLVRWCGAPALSRRRNSSGLQHGMRSALSCWRGCLQVKADQAPGRSRPGGGASLAQKSSVLPPWALSQAAWPVVGPHLSRVGVAPLRNQAAWGQVPRGFESLATCPWTGPMSSWTWLLLHV